MFDLSRKKTQPGTYYALAFCVHIIAFVMVCVSAFTPNWSRMTEYDGLDDIVYDRGLVVSCNMPANNGCMANAGFGNQSGEHLGSFIMAVFAIIVAFLTLQLFVVGQCVKSCRDTNLGIPLTVLPIVTSLFLITCLALFEVSVSKEPISGNTHVKDSFGFSRGIMVGAIVLYFCAAFFTLGEYFKRQKTSRNESITSLGHKRNDVNQHHSDGISASNDSYYRTRGSYDNDGKAPKTRGIQVWR